MIADSVECRIRMISGHVVEALARICAVCEPVDPDVEQVIAVPCKQVIAAGDLEYDVVFGGTEGRGHAGGVTKDRGNGVASGIGGWCAEVAGVLDD